MEDLIFDMTEEEMKDGAEAEADEVSVLDDSVKMYLKEIGEFPLLTAAEEIELAQAAESEAVLKQQIAETEEALGKRETKKNRKLLNDLLKQTDVIAEGEAARQKLINSNLRLVVSIAKKYMNSGIPMLDLIQEGNLGLLKAVEKYDWKQGFRFSTYATWWIRQGVTRFIADKGRVIRIPIHVTEDINAQARAFKQLQQDLGRTPNLKELADYMGIPVEKAAEIEKIKLVPESLKTPIGKEEDFTVADTVEDTNPGPEELAEKNDLKSCIQTALKRLTPREKEVIELRYGIGYDREYTLEELGRRFNLTRERIRQIEFKALRTIKHECGYKLAELA